MTSAPALESRDLALDLHHLLRELDPARFRAETDGPLRARVRTLVARLGHQLERAEALRPRLRERLAEVRDILGGQVPDEGLSVDEAHRRWTDLRQRCQPAYEGLAQALRAEGARHVPSLRPTNYLRNVFHVANAAMVILLVQAVLTTPPRLIGAAALACAAAWGTELARRRWPEMNTWLMGLFGGVAHPHESRRINSATWYTTALLFLAMVAGPEAGVVALAVLGAGDPAAALVGRRFGRTALIHGRTLEGSLAFVVVGTAAALAVLVLTTSWPLAWMWPRALVPAIAGAVAELWARRVDDNLAIPVAAGVAGVLLRLVGG